MTSVLLICFVVLGISASVALGLAIGLAISHDRCLLDADPEDDDTDEGAL